MVETAKGKKGKRRKINNKMREKMGRVEKDKDKMIQKLRKNIEIKRINFLSFAISFFFFFFNFLYQEHLKSCHAEHHA